MRKQRSQTVSVPYSLNSPTTLALQTREFLSILMAEQKLETKTQSFDTERILQAIKGMDTKFENKFQEIDKKLNRMSAEVSLLKGQFFEKNAREICGKKFGQVFSKNYVANSVCDLVRLVLSQDMAKRPNATQIVDESMKVMKKLLEVLCFHNFVFPSFFS
jgi:hypothetical protein